MLAELVPLIGFVPAYGPPAIFVLGPWLFLVLMLAGPFACLFALVVVMIVAATVLAALTAAILAILAAPYLLVRRLRGHGALVQLARPLLAILIVLLAGLAGALISASLTRRRRRSAASCWCESPAGWPRIPMRRIAFSMASSDVWRSSYVTRIR
jgi:hypothetical protein